MARKNAALRWSEDALSRDAQHALKRRAVLRKAAEAFSERGFQNTSLEEIAQSLNVTKPALYYYFKNKEELLYECHKVALALAEQAKTHALENGRTGLEKLTLLITKHIDLVTDELGRCSALTDLSALSPKYREEIRAGNKANVALVTSFLTEGMEDGSVRRCDPKLASHFVLGGLIHIVQWFSVRGERDSADVAAAFIDFITNGLKAEPAEPTAAPAKAGGRGTRRKLT